ncbi:hypothetical protein LWI28_007081 [Acer negundo]|uniref:Uncharacterized protein n=1 Tax=Acer negundo TaxID=4023 RepID=A0AAD5JJ97_ACENE|nr:hypothetical protein LWI28_007081 [Acer negundo]
MCYGLANRIGNRKIGLNTRKYRASLCLQLKKKINYIFNGGFQTLTRIWTNLDLSRLKQIASELNKIFKHKSNSLFVDLARVFV